MANKKGNGHGQQGDRCVADRDHTVYAVNRLTVLHVY